MNIIELFKENRNCYGYRRIHSELKKIGINRNFHADEPNKKWLTDITKFAIPAGKVYLSPIN